MFKQAFLLRIGKIFLFLRSFSENELFINPFASLQLDWSTTTGRLLGPTTCLPHKDGDISFSVLLKDTTNKLAGLFSTLSLFVLSAKQGSCEYDFLKSFGMTRLGK